MKRILLNLKLSMVSLFIDIIWKYRVKEVLTMPSKPTQMDLQHDFKKKNNKPGSTSSEQNNGDAIREGKQIVKTRD